jgi:hypothetical protein
MNMAFHLSKFDLRFETIGKPSTSLPLEPGHALPANTLAIMSLFEYLQSPSCPNKGLARCALICETDLPYLLEFFLRNVSCCQLGKHSGFRAYLGERSRRLEAEHTISRLRHRA